MCEVPVFYTTSSGHTQRIAEHLAARLRLSGIASGAVNLADSGAERISWPEVRGAVVAVPLRLGCFDRSARAFASRCRVPLSAMPSLFVAVSLSAASQQPGERESALDEAKRFIVETGWTPSSVASVAGALSYTRYNALVRWMMRRYAAREGNPTDTTRDHVLTDWQTIDRLADDLAEQVLSGGHGLQRQHA
jgi:menaquinone-dependent protoporphyrinogen oxidase